MEQRTIGTKGTGYFLKLCFEKTHGLGPPHYGSLVLISGHPVEPALDPRFREDRLGSGAEMTRSKDRGVRSNPRESRQDAAPTMVFLNRVMISSGLTP